MSSRANTSQAASGNEALIGQVFGKYLLLSILITLSATLGMMIDNIIAGNLLGEDCVGAIGLCVPVVFLLSAAAGILETGAVALAGRAMGSRDSARVNALFSVSCFAALLVGALLSALLLLFPGQVAGVLGPSAGSSLHGLSTEYLFGYGFGGFAVLLNQVGMGFGRLDNDPTRGLVAIVGMTVTDIVLDLFMVAVLGLGMFGMGLASALSYVVAAAICYTHFLSPRNTLRVCNPLKSLALLGGICRTGAPDSVSRVCVMVRTYAFNMLLLMLAGTSAVNALSALTSISNLLSSVLIGVGQTVTLLCAIFYGERDREAIRSTLKVALRKGEIVSLIMSAAAFVFAGQLAALFGSSSPETLAQIELAIRCYCVFVPFSLVNSSFQGHCQATGNIKAANLITAGEGLVFALLFALAASPLLAENALWLAFPVGSACTMLATMAIASLSARRRGGKEGLLDAMLFLPPDFDAEAAAAYSVPCQASIDSVVEASRKVQDWARAQGCSTGDAYLLSLAVEEMGGNVVRHGFSGVRHPVLDIKLVARSDKAITLRLRDNGTPFNPLDYDMQSEGDFSCIGLKMIRSSIRDVRYSNVVGLNNLLVSIDPSDSRS